MKGVRLGGFVVGKKGVVDINNITCGEILGEEETGGITGRGVQEGF